MTDIIVLDHVSKFYSPLRNRAVFDLSLKIREGEFFCLAGQSGSGKSTILKLIAGIEKPSQGKVAAPENIGMVFQLGALLPWLTVSENAAFGLKMKGANKTKIKETTHKYLELVGLKEYRKKYPRELSGGQRQRVGIARALAVEPPVLLLDEPFSSLDFLTTEELHKDLLDIWKMTKKTIVMVSHLMEEAVMLADRVGVMKEGRLGAVLEVGLPRPRSYKKEEFAREVERIRKTI
ncbi:ABC transporter ATP-binding protein [Patescibacteria group bacterium]|nr:ABC transporter ATP-binding protein [Patescibacteria group bacterium]MCL5010247.1 ABC transporter ATP-binding protein [Patescibacteria group bacterium]